MIVFPVALATPGGAVFARRPANTLGSHLTPASRNPHHATWSERTKSGVACGQVGDAVMGSLGVQHYAKSNGSSPERCNTALTPLSSWLGPIGVSGLTAYCAMFDGCTPQSGESSAAVVISREQR